MKLFKKDLFKKDLFKKDIKFDSIRKIIINFIVAFGVAVLMEVVASISGIPLGLLVVFVVFVGLCYGQKKFWF